MAVRLRRHEQKSGISRCSRVVERRRSRYFRQERSNRVRGYGQCADSTNRPTLTRAEDWRRSAILAAIGALAIALGVIVYLTDRDTSNSALIPSVAWLAGYNLFGVLAGWLPSFVHTFAFSLFTVAVLPQRSVPRYGACFVWFAVNMAFEIGQHPQVSVRLAEALQGGLGVLPFSGSFANYFLHGTFDPGDIVAALLGAVTAGVVLRLMHRE